MNAPNDLALCAASQLVPVSYAEKAMASLLQLHCELMDEKERRVELFRKLMEKEQALAELKMYVKLLEEKAAAPPAVVAAPEPPPPAPRPPPPAVPFVARSAPTYPRPFASRPVRVQSDGWKTW